MDSSFHRWLETALKQLRSLLFRTPGPLINRATCRPGVRVWSLKSAALTTQSINLDTCSIIFGFGSTITHHFSRPWTEDSPRGYITWPLLYKALCTYSVALGELLRNANNVPLISLYSKDDNTWIVKQQVWMKRHVARWQQGIHHVQRPSFENMMTQLHAILNHSERLSDCLHQKVQFKWYFLK